MRKGWTARLAAVWLCLLLLCPSALGESAEQPEEVKLRALLIGCDHFITQTDTWPAADSNLRLLSDTLVSDSRHYALIRSYSSAIASVDAFEEAVVGAFSSGGDQDISLLYISTHGVFEEGVSNAEAGLLLSDGETEALLTAPDLQRILDRIPGKKVVILDACNSGAIIGKGLSGGADRCFLTGPDYKVLCSAGGSEASWYFQSGPEAAAAGASYFATVLAYGLGAQGDHAADRNDDGVITLMEVYAFLCDNYAASTPQVYPQEDGAFLLYTYDPSRPVRIQKAVTDIAFEDTLLTAGQSEVTFSFTVQRQVELYYQIIYHQDGAWQFAHAQQYLDGEQTDGTVLPGRKMRTLSLNTGRDAYGYAIVQLITLEGGQPVFQGARLLCVQPALGQVKLRVLCGVSFVPSLGQELPILAQHDVPCGLTVNILNEEGRLVRRLAYEAPSRPQQLSPAASSFYWNGLMNDGQPAPVGAYRVQVRARLQGETFIAESEPFYLVEAQINGPAAGNGGKLFNPAEISAIPVLYFGEHTPIISRGGALSGSGNQASPMEEP